jgi:hypothetical protein
MLLFMSLFALDENEIEKRSLHPEKVWRGRSFKTDMRTDSFRDRLEIQQD